IAPPSFEALRARLLGRGTDDAAEVERRLAVAREELHAQPEFAHVIVNDQLEQALAQLVALVEREPESEPESESDAQRQGHYTHGQR
ncbi:MAG: hypothetical protein FWD42_00600, partial [Solirubrobacterales bacterium]|nr:hypothetical protein [Solirubrobacterales bacterium]